MIGSHDYYPRSTHGVFALLAAACAACLVQLNSKAFRRGLACLSACVGIVCGIHMLEAGYDIASYWMMDHVRTQTLRQEISELDEPAAANIISYGIEPYTNGAAHTACRISAKTVRIPSLWAAPAGSA